MRDWHIQILKCALRKVATAVDEIITHKQMMVLAPSETDIELGIKRFRQAAYKFEFKSKRASLML